MTCGYSLQCCYMLQGVRCFYVRDFHRSVCATVWKQLKLNLKNYRLLFIATPILNVFQELLRALARLIMLMMEFCLSYLSG